MKVLIVEDDSDKLQKVAATVLKCGEQGTEIDTAQNAAQAKRALAKTEYDLLILDVALPPSADLIANPLGGVELLRSISRSNRYKKPRAIIGLTAYSDLISQVTPQFRMESWTLVHFDRASEEWASQIERKIRYLRDSNSSPTEPGYGCELCVLTALYDPEFKALQRLPWGWSRLTLPGDAGQYWEGQFSREDEQYKVVAAYASKPGMTFSAALAMKMISQFRPKLVAMVGIAAGIRGKCILGDAIVADPCWDWGHGKFKDSEAVTVFEPAPFWYFFVGIFFFCRCCAVETTAPYPVCYYCVCVFC
jgi:CheY-like chemotaxis protein